MLLHGDFSATVDDDPFQVIPTDWIDAAMDRWKVYMEKNETRPKGIMDSMGVDCARGGRDNSVCFKRYGRFFDVPKEWPGRMTPDGPTLAGLVVAERRNDCPVHVDLLGIGASVVDFLNESGVHVVQVNGAAGIHQTDITGNLRFVNYRAWMIWSMREALDPQYGQNIMLPPDDDLRADLASYKFKLTARGIQVRDKDEIKKEIGRSPDKGDACCYANIHTPKRNMHTDWNPNEQKNVGDYDPYE
jgi:hypothetical protein